MGQAQNIKWDACIKIQGVNNSEGEGWQGKEKDGNGIQTDRAKDPGI